MVMYLAVAICGAEERVGFDGWDDVDILGWLADIVRELTNGAGCSSCPIR